MKDEKIAYLILAHSDIENFQRLIRAINYKCDIYVHVDLKADINEFMKKNYDFGNVHFIEERYDISWAGFNMIQATKALIKKAITKKDEYIHLVLLSGMDYPIKDNKYIYNFFKTNRNTEFIRAFSVTNEGDSLDKRKIINYWFWDINICRNIKVNKIVRKILYYICRFKTKPDRFVDFDNTNNEVCYGSQWWAITPMCAQYILEYIESNKNIDDYFKYSFAPDEMYFHTIIFNSKFKENTINKEIEKRYIHWEWSNIHHIDPSLSKYFNESDIEELKDSKKLFVRKVNTMHSSKLLNYIDEYILT